LAADDDRIRSELLAERAAVEAQLVDLNREFAAVVHAQRDVATDDEHDPEGSTIAYERARTLALADQARDRLAAVDAALIRLDGETYGICARCGGPIAAERLAARPTAEFCIRCV
jgi:DnaK suppressor protein